MNSQTLTETRFKERIERSIYDVFQKTPSFRHGHGVFFYYHATPPSHVTVAVELYRAVDFGPGVNRVYLQKHFFGGIPEFVRCFKFQNLKDLKTVTRPQLWDLFLQGNGKLKCLVNDRIHWFERTVGSPQSLQFYQDDLDFTPMTLDPGRFTSVVHYWQYAWDFCTKP